VDSEWLVAGQRIDQADGHVACEDRYAGKGKGSGQGRGLSHTSIALIYDIYFVENQVSLISIGIQLMVFYLSGPLERGK